AARGPRTSVGGPVRHLASGRMPQTVLSALGITGDARFVQGATGRERPEAGIVPSVNPATGQAIGAARLDDAASYERTISGGVESFHKWREGRAPVRGQVVRAIAEEYRRLKEPLGELVSMEMGKIRPEGLGEVQETIDIADFAVGLSRQLPGLTIPSE